MVSTLENPRAFSAPRTVGIRHCTVMNFAVIWHKDRLGLVGYRPRPFLTLVSAIDHWIWWRLEYLDDPLVAQSNIQMKLFYWCMICYIYIYIILYHIYIYIILYAHRYKHIYIYTYGTIWNYCLIPSDPRLRGPKALLGRLAFDLRALLRPWRRSGWCHAVEPWTVAIIWGISLGDITLIWHWYNITWHNINMTLIDFEIQGYPSETRQSHVLSACDAPTSMIQMWDLWQVGGSCPWLQSKAKLKRTRRLERGRRASDWKGWKLEFLKRSLESNGSVHIYVYMYILLQYIYIYLYIAIYTYIYIYIMYGRSGYLCFSILCCICIIYSSRLATQPAAAQAPAPSRQRVLDEWLQLSCLLPPGRWGRLTNGDIIGVSY